MPINTDIIVHVGTDPSSGLEVYRKFSHFVPLRTLQKVHFFYEEYFLSNGIKIISEDPTTPILKYYVVKNVLTGDLQVDDSVIGSDYAGYDILFNFNIGGLPDPTTLNNFLVSLITGRFTSIPIGALNGYIITS